MNPRKIAPAETTEAPYRFTHGDAPGALIFHKNGQTFAVRLDERGFDTDDYANPLNAAFFGDDAARIAARAFLADGENAAHETR